MALNKGQSDLAYQKMVEAGFAPAKTGGIESARRIAAPRKIERRYYYDRLYEYKTTTPAV
jgi:hypothetical protein